MDELQAISLQIPQEYFQTLILLVVMIVFTKGGLDQRKKTNTDTGTSSALGSDGILNDATPRVDAAKKVVSPSVVEETVAKESPMVNTTDLGSNPPLPTQEANSASNAPGTSLMSKSDGTLNDATPCSKEVVSPFVVNDTMEKEKLSHVVTTTESSHHYIHSSSTGLFSFQFSSMDELDAMLENVWVKLHGVLVTAFSEDGLSAIATKLGTPLMLGSYTADMCMQSWGRSSYARAMIELRADIELEDNIMTAMPKITEEGYYTCNIRVEYEWKPPRCTCCKVFGHVLEECPKNIGAGAIKNLKKTSQTLKGIPVGQKLGFKPKQVYHPVSKKSTANTYGKKMNNSESTKEVIKSNPFEVLTSIDNDVALGTNGGISNSADKGTINFSSSNTSIGEKIDKIERQICEGKVRFVDDDGNPLVPTGIVDSDSEVEAVFDETANLRISKSGNEVSDKSYGANSLLEQWRDSNSDDDDYDPYDDDMYENHDMSDHLQSICDDLDITVRGRKKKHIFLMFVESVVI
ncbi:nucleotide-diphospho-sugar transferase [Tanacetum coccineum]